ncbi:MAG: hypothetical protein RSP_26580 [Rhodanobacter sp.]
MDWKFQGKGGDMNRVLFMDAFGNVSAWRTVYGHALRGCGTIQPCLMNPLCCAP